MTKISRENGRYVSTGDTWTIPDAEFDRTVVPDEVAEGDTLYTYNETDVTGYYVAIAGKWRKY